jgi:hypothetical protein
LFFTGQVGTHNTCQIRIETKPLKRHDNNVLGENEII